MSFGKKFLLILIVEVIALIILGVGMLGINRYTGNWSIGDGFSSLAALFGGIGSFWGMLAVLGVAILAYCLIVLAIKRANDHNPKTTPHVAAIIALALLIAGGFITWKWVRLPSGAGLVALAMIAFLLIVTVVILTIGRKDEPVKGNAPQQSTDAQTVDPAYTGSRPSMTGYPAPPDAYSGRPSASWASAS